MMFIFVFVRNDIDLFEECWNHLFYVLGTNLHQQKVGYSEENTYIDTPKSKFISSCSLNASND